MHVRRRRVEERKDQEVFTNNTIISKSLTLTTSGSLLLAGA
jgi:hypothetical protein